MSTITNDMPAGPSVTVAKDPFDIRTSDVIIRTSDNVDFYLVQLILSIASVFFRIMFSMAQPPGTSTSTTSEVIPIAEDSETFDCLMRYVYPVDDPVINDLGLMERVLTAAVKYDISETIKLTCRALRTQFCNTHPLDVYAIACLLDMEEEAANAAKVFVAANVRETLSHSSRAAAPFKPRLQHVSAGAYYRLVQYLRNRGGAVATRFTDGKPIAGQTASEPVVDIAELDTASPDIDTTGADIVLHSSSHVAFPVHSLVLRLASAEKLLECPRNLDGAIATDLDTSTLALLLSVCYPLKPWDSSKLPSVLKLYHAACKYEIKPVIAAIRRRFKDLIGSCPNLMSMYLIAAEQEWSEEAQEIAVAIARRGQEHLYALEMDNTSVPALAYYHLLNFCADFEEAVVSTARGQQTSSHGVNFADKYEGLSYGLITVPLPVVESLLTRFRGPRGEPQPSNYLSDSKPFTDKLDHKLSQLRLSFAPYEEPFLYMFEDSD